MYFLSGLVERDRYTMLLEPLRDLEREELREALREAFRDLERLRDLDALRLRDLERLGDLERDLLDLLLELLLLDR